MKHLNKLAMLLMAICVISAFYACGSDDDSNEDNSDSGNKIVNSIVGTWVDSNGTAITFSSNYTGSISNSSSSRWFNGNFKYGAPYEVEVDVESVCFLIDVTFTSGDHSGEETDWEIEYSEFDKTTIRIEGRTFFKK
jgi:hypothetical protein